MRSDENVVLTVILDVQDELVPRQVLKACGFVVVEPAHVNVGVVALQVRDAHVDASVLGFSCLRDAILKCDIFNSGLP